MLSTTIALNELNTTLQIFIMKSANYIIQFKALYGRMLAYQIFVFIHLMFFGFAFSLVAREYWKMFINRQVNIAEIKQVSEVIILLLLGLWITGIGLIYMTSGFDINKIIESPKSMAKIFVVLGLTANVFVFYGFVLPGLQSNTNIKGRGASLIAATEAISIVSWAYAAFIGVGRLIDPAINFIVYIELYGILLLLGIVISLFTVHPIIKQHLTTRFHQTYVLRKQ